ncbi:MAG: hypothetical protein E7378_03595 [Clostridiales bacterium]|nr:hypothetical protein [Clostridiales bacterium]
MTDYLQFINPSDLVGKQIKKPPSVYTIIEAQKHNGKLYIAFADVETKTIFYGEQQVSDEIKELRSLNLANYDDERSDGTLLCPTVIEVKDLFLLRKEGRNASDVRVVEDWDNILFNINEIYHETSDEFNGVYGDPFIVDGKPVTSYKEIDFTPEEHQLRMIFASVLPDNVREKYVSDFKKYCFNRILKLNDLYVKYTKKALSEIQEEFNARNSAYLSAVEGLIKVKTKLQTPVVEQSTNNDEKVL